MMDLRIGDRIREQWIPLLKILITVESVVLIVFSALPVGSLPSLGTELPFLDYLQHYLAYLVYGLLLGALWIRGLDMKKGVVMVLIVGIDFGLVNELIQLFAPTRIFDPIDIAVNALGILTATGVLFLKERRKA